MTGKRPPLQKQKACTGLDRVIGERLRARRMERHISQMELGERIGVSFQQVQKYERGINRIGSGRLSQIARVLEVDVAFFFGDLGGQGLQTSPLHAFLATRDGLDINEAMMALQSHELRRSVIDFVRKLSRCGETCT